MDLLFDLIKEANPGIEFPFTPSTMKVSIPVSQAIPPGGIVDTNIVVTPRTNEHWFGAVKVRYRRLRLDSIFKNMTPVPLEYYSATPATTTGLFVENLNRVYGTSFLPNDFTFAPNTTLQANGNFALTPVAGNLCYSPTGGSMFIWRNVKPFLKQVTSNGTLTGRQYPGGNDFVTPGRKPQGEYLAYGIDFTGLGISGSGSGTVPNNAAWIKILAPIFANDPRFDVTKVASGTEGVQGLTFVLYTLPNALVPEANSAKYKNVMTLSGGAGLWFQGRIMMHYN